MEKAAFAAGLTAGLEALGVVAFGGPGGAAYVGLTEQLWDLACELERWNKTHNLTAAAKPAEALETHILDSLALLPELTGVRRLLDVGTGAGFPGLPCALALPALEATLIDGVTKKIGFVKYCIVRLGLVSRVRALHARAEGRPGPEGLGAHDAAVARAVTDVAQWLALAKHYVPVGGKVIAMLGRPVEEAELRALAVREGATLHSVRSFALPTTQAPRSVVVFHVERFAPSASS